MSSVELKEHLGGFYIIEATDLDDAIAVANKCPSANAIEVRTVMVFDS
ncbi:MAG: YciI family protein [Thermomicrobiales bacterium]